MGDLWGHPRFRKRRRCARVSDPAYWLGAISFEVHNLSSITSGAKERVKSRDIEVAPHFSLKCVAHGVALSAQRRFIGDFVSYRRFRVAIGYTD
jgi:hypothetical protein